MPLHHCIILLLVALGLAWVAARRAPHVRARLMRKGLWATLVVTAAAMGSVSGLASATGHAGTGFVTRHGWPKPYLFRFVSEDGARTTSFDPLYFAGNAMAYAAGLVAIVVAASVLLRGASRRD